MHTGYIYVISNLDAIIELAEILGLIYYCEFTSAFPFSLIFVELTLINVMNQRRKIILGIFIVFAITALMTYYAIYLNKLFYTNYAPFYDSVAYLNDLFDVIQKTKSQGIFYGFQKAINNRTLVLPFLQAVLMAPFINQPTRELGPLIQLPWLALFANSIFIYFLIFRRKTLLWSLALTLPFLTISALWRYNGGLSDFRMDLLHYLLLGSTFVWFLSTRYTKSYWPWVLTGIFAGLTFLTRGTSPVYMGFCLAPLLVVRFFLTDKIERSKIVSKITLCFLLTVLISSWFYIINFDYLYFYYVLWNTDANASLAIQQSIKHANFAMWNIGIYAFSIGMASFCLTGLIYWQKKSSLPLKILFRQVNWESLWLAVSPILILVLIGAGLNRWVVMPAAFGILMFLLDPILEKQKFPKKTPEKPVIIILTVASSLLFLISAFQGMPNHSHPINKRKLPMFYSMKPQHLIVEKALKDISQFSTEDRLYLGVTYTHYINIRSLDNILKFDYLTSSLPDQIKLASKLKLSRIFHIASPYTWKNLPGKTDSEKIRNLVNRANKELKYVIIPEDKSISYIESLPTAVITNRHLSQIKKQLLISGNWQEISDSIQVDNYEFVRLYRNKLKALSN